MLADVGDIRARFEWFLHERALKGQSIPTETGFNRDTYVALMAVARAHPNANPALIAAAKAAFERQVTQNRTNRT